MKRIAAPLLAAAAALSLTACERPSQREPQARDRALQESIQAPQDRARAVEADVLESKRRTDEALEEQGG